MYILDHAVAPWFLEVTLNLKRSVYFLLPQNLPWHPPAPPAAESSSLIQRFPHTHTHTASHPCRTSLLSLRGNPVVRRTLLLLLQIHKRMFISHGSTRSTQFEG